MIIQSFAKVNLFLEVLHKRKDNFHNIDSLFERISLSDKIILKNRRDNFIKANCNDPRVPLDETNLCFKAAKLLQDKFKIKKGLDIKIIKRIPVGAGLGGGSSNAASVLLALNRLWRLKLSKVKLAKLAAKIGSDVTFFVYEAAFARVRGRGEKIHALNKLNKVRLWHILVVPKIHVSTPLIYKKWDDFGVLTKPVSNVKILTSVLLKKDNIFKPGFLFNSLEQVTLKLYPEVIRVKETLAGLGLKSALMSGSGPAVFAPVASGKKAAALVKKVNKEGRPWLTFAVSTV
ncbi:MAG: 4-(cytidine 5'-diphospho)-2-C-methyl-D-erythritol kinase [Candidatus Omnitrophota bacterium]|nr:4-(cytidine 5'-diphospho)-2-C-methyl-D-erythritol kinase [Candidatus Omnitrophota bacterium]